MLWPTDDELEEMLENLFDEPTQEREVTVPDISPQEAMEANKTRDTCIVCGKPTIKRALLSSTVNTCQCVENMLKGD